MGDAPPPLPPLPFFYTLGNATVCGKRVVVWRVFSPSSFISTPFFPPSSSRSLIRSATGGGEGVSPRRPEDHYFRPFLLLLYFSYLSVLLLLVHNHCMRCETVSLPSLLLGLHYCTYTTLHWLGRPGGGRDGRLSTVSPRTYHGPGHGRYYCIRTLLQWHGRYTMESP